MRTLRTLAAVLLAVPALAVAQDGSRPQLPDPKGVLLLEAVPARADLVVHTPDLPALLASASEAGLGSAQAWRDGFRAQMRDWGERTGLSEDLAKGASALLAAADGEVLIAGLRLPPIEGPERATVFAMRTSRSQKQLKGALENVVEGGLRAVYPGAPRTEEIHGRPVLALHGIGESLYITMQDGLVVASDHPLAMGLLYRGMEKLEGPGKAGKKLLEVRYGRGDAQWVGWLYGERESVSWKTSEAGPVALPLPPGIAPIVSVATSRPTDLPVLPVPAPTWVEGLPALPGRPVQLALPAAGGVAVSGVLAEGLTAPKGVSGDQTAATARSWSVVRGAPAGALKNASTGSGGPVAGAATRLGWLDAWASGRLALPLPSLDRAHLAGPLKSASRDGDALLTWTATDQAGELRGPRWHGPCTFLALRTLHDIATKTAPGSSVVRRGARAPLPPTLGGAELPKPVKAREGPEDGE